MAIYSSAQFETPVGTLVAIASEQQLYVLTFLDAIKEKIFNHNLPFDPLSITKDSKPSSVLKKTELWLKNYFSNKFYNLNPPALAILGTPFSVNVLETLMSVPLGQTQSYSQLARDVGSPKAVRAVGTVLRNNPIAIINPCHRIIGANGALTGYNGGLDRKQWLLEHEGRILK